MVGGARHLAPESMTIVRVSAYIVALTLLLTAGGGAAAQSLYKYRGESGEWIYADRPSSGGRVTETRYLESHRSEAGITVTREFIGRTVRLTAHNEFYAPVEIAVEIQLIRGLQYPHPDETFRWVLPPRSDTTLLTLEMLEDGSTPSLQYQFEYLAGEPNARHQPTGAYRAPFAIARSYSVTQAFPRVATHTSADSYYAIDVAMPVGTGIFAAREGVVFDVAASNFRGGLDPQRDGLAAIVICILHDDGTYALYAHLNTNTIRVRPGDRVRRGEYIADSGNTGFSSEPHLHFAVLRNTGMRTESVPVDFTGATANSVIPASGMLLTAY
jgi:murein DD-endopeptidase MepM/ murein hydrolase activator NlpD